jgi:hypothetical protein
MESGQADTLTNVTHEGSCLCGAIQYAVEDQLKLVVNCHCRFCSRAHGAAFATLLFMPFAKLELTKGKELLAHYETKASGALRAFCSLCGTRLYNHAPSVGMVSLVVATLNTSAEIRPIANINVESKCAWHPINDGLPQFQASPSRSEFGQLLSG